MLEVESEEALSSCWNPEAFRVENGRLQIGPRAAEPQAIMAALARYPSGARQHRKS